MRFVLPAPLLLLTAACAMVPETGPQRPPSSSQPRVQQPVPPTRPSAPAAIGARPPQVLRLPGLENVIEHDTASLVRRFGDPRLDVREGDMRKLQFAGQSCVLDVFLYPLREGAEPVATHVEARRPSDGQDVDRAACVASLQR